MLSVGAGAVLPTEEAIMFHVMSDCSSFESREEVVANLNALSLYLLAQLHTHTHKEYVMPR